MFRSVRAMGCGCQPGFSNQSTRLPWVESTSTSGLPSPLSRPRPPGTGFGVVGDVVALETTISGNQGCRQKD